MNRKALHFGGGALGRGLVVPFLEEAGFDVVIADIDQKLVDALNENQGYELVQTDNKEKVKKICIEKAVLFDASKDELREALEQAEVITTSVRKENLKYVAALFDKVLDPSAKKLVICAENVEKSGEYFKSLMADNENNKGENLFIPDTVVDRICASMWPESLQIMTETFGEFGYDAHVYQGQLDPIKEMDDLNRAFVRKRLLVNTYSDASCFLGMAKGDRYLFEAIEDRKVQEELEPYFNAFEQVLTRKYGYTADEIAEWKKLYHKRLGNPEILRDISTVARSLWAKLKVEERFLLPIVELKEIGGEIAEPLKALLYMIEESCGESPKELEAHLKELWCGCETGREIYREARKILER